jgi:hypothetical protein
MFRRLVNSLFSDTKDWPYAGASQQMIVQEILKNGAFKGI